MNPVIVRNEIEPLLNALIRQLCAEGRATEQAIYLRIRESLASARSPCDLTRPLNDISTMAHVRPNASGDADALLGRIIEKAERLLLVETNTPVVH